MSRGSVVGEAPRVTRERIEELSSRWLEPGHSLEWHCLFVLPPWLRSWWNAFGDAGTLSILWVGQGEDLIGIAPLRVQEAEASFVGAPDVCDYLDFITAAGRGPEFARALLDELRRRQVRVLELGPVRADSRVMREFLPEAKRRGCGALVKREDVSYELELPVTWEDYLGMLKGTERHEIRRKLKRLGEAGRIEFRTVADPQGVPKAMDTFLRLFGASRADKSAFLTSRRVRFFRSLAEDMAREGLLRLSFLELDDEPAAAVMCFQDRSTVYLYNNGYDQRFRSLSVGLLSKVLSIREAIREGKKRFDFLKGPEPYKRQLGGKPVSLYRCRVLIG